MAEEIPHTDRPKPTEKKGGNGKSLIRTVDPEGYEISLDLDTWEHVITRHPEMAKYYDHLEHVLHEPELIQRSSKESETHYYYRLTGRAFYRFNDIYISAVVRRSEETKTGSVKTAHLIKELRKEGQTVWMKRK